MNISDDIFDQLRAYVAGDLNEQQALSLEKQIAERPELKSELNFTRKLMAETEALERKRLLEMVEGAMEGDFPDMQKQGKVNWIIWLSIVSLILILSIAVWKFYLEQPGEEIAPPNQEQITIPIAKTIIKEEYLDNGRVEKNLLKPFNTLSDVEEQVLLIQKKLAENRYDEVIVIVERLSPEHPHFRQLQLISAYCSMQQSEYDASIAQLDLIMQSNSNVFIKEEAEWLRAIVLIMQENKNEEAQRVLKFIAEKQGHSYQSEAEVLYVKLDQN